MVIKEASKHQAVTVDFNFPGINWNTLH